MQGSSYYGVTRTPWQDVASQLGIKVVPGDPTYMTIKQNVLKRGITSIDQQISVTKKNRGLTPEQKADQIKGLNENKQFYKKALIELNQTGAIPTSVDPGFWETLLQMIGVTSSESLNEPTSPLSMPTGEEEGGLESILPGSYTAPTTPTGVPSFLQDTAAPTTNYQDFDYTPRSFLTP